MPNPTSCACCGDWLPGRFDRRGLLKAAGMAGLAAAALPFRAWAAEGDYDAMLLSCIDPRMVTPVYDYMQKRGLAGKYSQFVIAGAAIAVVAPKFAAWRPAFWDNTATTLQLHRINKIIAIDHRDCGAAKVAYGDDSIANPEVETRTHREVLAEFRAAVAKHQPQLTVETGLMALDGSIQMFS
ncbi:MAG TPA: twin-arginine translocation signal domain-containing protein [Stellaceae bacterium]|jgi:carbonic anhydrase